MIYDDLSFKNTKKIKQKFLVNYENYYIFALAITEKKFLQNIAKEGCRSG